MSPETIVQLLQFGAMGLLAFMIWTGKSIMDSHLATLKILIDGNQRLMERMIDALLELRNEQVKAAQQGFFHERSGASQTKKTDALT